MQEALCPLTMREFHMWLKVKIIFKAHTVKGKIEIINNYMHPIAASTKTGRIHTSNCNYKLHACIYACTVIIVWLPCKI